MANIDFKCPCCGGTLNFDNKSQNIVCPYCDSQFSASDLQQYNDELATDGQEDTAWDESMVEAYTSEEMKGMKIYTCNSCGGEVICEETTSSTFCPYCGNNMVVSKEVSGDLKPNLIIPFKKDKAAAVEAFKKHLSHKPLLPGSFKKQNTIEETKSLYVPFWVFDADVSGKVRYKGEKTRRWEDANYRYEETRYYSLVRGGGVGFEHVPVDGSKKMDDQLMESIEPYTWSETKEFNVAYLAGYAADRYDVSKDETFERATVRFKEGTAEAFKRDIHGYQNVRTDETNLQFSNTQTRYVLYPVWTLNVKWKDQLFRFGMNGETGKIAGNLPISVPKAILFFLSFFLGIGALAFFIVFAICGFAADKALLSVIIGVILGLIVAVSVLGAFRRKNKNVHFSYGAFPYEKKDSCYIDVRKDIFLYSKIRKTAKPKNNSNRR
jgi:DNA-directed RNA polymerase subunit RPC12/RpoP